MIVPVLPAIAPMQPPSLGVMIYGEYVPLAVSGIHFSRRDLAQVRVRNGVIERRVVQGIPNSSPAVPTPAVSVRNEDSLGWIDVGVIQVRRRAFVITAGDIFGPPAITHQFERVREAEERREFGALLDASSIGKPPKGYENEPSIGSGMCQPCRADQCAEVGCAIAPGCACSCTADKEVLAEEVSTALTRLLCRDLSDDDAAEIADELYRNGWRRET
jgi:hypothetical protein